jgi:hypothetical protein
MTWPPPSGVDGRRPFFTTALSFDIPTASLWGHYQLRRIGDRLGQFVGRGFD